MGAFIHVFSKFTPELLLFEAALVSLLIAAYGALWVIRRKRLGDEEITIKAGVVRNYLGALVADAEAMRRQLFALLNGEGVDTSLLNTGPTLGTLGGFSSPLPAATPQVTVLKSDDPQLQEKLAQIEKSMNDQAKALETIQTQKVKLETELAAAKAGGAGAEATSNGNSADLDALKTKIAELEAKLAEYSVIEDDLANLKRLQQENLQLKQKLGGDALATENAVPAAAAVAAAAVTTAAEPTVEATTEPTSEPTAEPTPASLESLAVTTPESSPSPAPSAEENPASPAAPEVSAAAIVPATPADANPLADLPTGASAAEAAPAPAASETPMEGNLGSNDADLVAEFEKMLNG